MEDALVHSIEQRIAHIRRCREDTKFVVSIYAAAAIIYRIHRHGKFTPDEATKIINLLSKEVFPFYVYGHFVNIVNVKTDFDNDAKQNVKLVSSSKRSMGLADMAFVSCRRRCRSNMDSEQVKASTKRRRRS